MEEAIRSESLAIQNDGERVTHLCPDECYYAHLSIYHFALPSCHGKIVLDAGSGAGYGAHYLAQHEARQVTGVELDPEAVRFSQKHFQRSNLRYLQMNLEDIARLPQHAYDVIFSSNVLEHVPQVEKFFHAAWKLLKPDGILIVAVPPIVNDWTWKANEENVFHLNLWTPNQWYSVLERYFADIQCYSHFFNKPGCTLDFSTPPEQVTINEQDFAFDVTTLPEMYSGREPLTVVFTARLARSEQTVRQLQPLTFVDHSITRPPAAPPPAPQPKPQGETWAQYLIRRTQELLAQGGTLFLFRFSAGFVGRRLSRLLRLGPGQKE